MKNLTLKAAIVSASFAALTLATSRAAVVYSDDFTSNPFTSAWSQTKPDGSYGLQWTGNSTPNTFGGPAVSLPANANAHSVYSFSDGTRTMSTTNTSVPSGVSGWTTMTYSVDFQMGGTGGTDNNYIAILVNRSGDNGYTPGIYTGGSGNIGFLYNGNVSAFSGYLAQADTWYRFATTATLSGGTITMQSYILDLSNTVLATSATFVENSAAYLDPNGFKLTLGNNGGYWNHATQIDNFVVTAVPEPSTGLLMLATAAVGSLVMRRRRSAV